MDQGLMTVSLHTVCLRTDCVCEQPRKPFSTKMEFVCSLLFFLHKVLFP